MLFIYYNHFLTYKLKSAICNKKSNAMNLNNYDTRNHQKNKTPDEKTCVFLEFSSGFFHKTKAFCNVFKKSSIQSLNSLIVKKQILACNYM